MKMYVVKVLHKILKDYDAEVAVYEKAFLQHK